MNDFTSILAAAEQGDAHAAEQLLPLVYDELRRLAAQRLSQEDPACAELVKLRFFAGLTLQEAAASLGVARRTADRWWAFARSWLYTELRQGDDPAAG